MNMKLLKQRILCSRKISVMGKSQSILVPTYFRLVRPHLVCSGDGTGFIAPFKPLKKIMFLIPQSSRMKNFELATEPIL